MVQELAVAVAVPRTGREVPARVDDERGADRPDQPRAEGVAANHQPQPETCDELDCDAAHRDRELCGQARRDGEVIANPAAREPEQLDVGDPATDGERRPTVAEQLVRDEPGTARRQGDGEQ
jgi:hypothetical protein